MTPWVALLFWSLQVAALLRNGMFERVSPRRHARWSGTVAINRAGLTARVTTGLLAMFAIAPLVFLFAVRRDVGTDYVSYVEMFERFRSGESLPWIEPLYGALNRLAAPLGSSGVIAVFAVSALLAAFPLFYRVFRSSPMPWLGVLIIFGYSFPFFMSNGVRSAIAIGIVMLVLPMVWRRHLLAWSLGILFAAGFHYTALLVWPLYWFLHLAWPRVLVLFGLVVAVTLSTIEGLARAFLQWVPVALPSAYAHYPDRVLQRLGTFEFGFGYLIYLALAGLVLLVWNSARNEGREVLVFRNTTILGLLLMIGLYQFWAVNRLGLYFMPGIAVFLPWVINRCVAPQERVLWVAGAAALFGLLFCYGLWVGSHQAVPYQWIL